MTITVTAAPRDQFGTKAAALARAQGRVPLTVCRSGDDSRHLFVGGKDADEIIKHVGQVVALDQDGTVCQVLVKGFHAHPIKDDIQQIDTLEVTDDKEVRVEVPISPDTRDCPGTKAGGLLEIMVRKVAIRCPAKDIPDSLPVDLSKISIGQTVYASSVILPEGATLVTRPRVALCTVIKTRGMRRAEAAARLGGEE